MRDKIKISRLSIVLISLLLVSAGAGQARAEDQDVLRQGMLQESRKHFLKGEELYGQDEYLAADAEFKKAQELLEQFEDSEKALDENILDFEGAGKSVVQAMETYVIYVNQAINLSKNNQPQRAIRAYLQALEFVPYSSNIHYNLAIEYIRIRQYPKAAEHLRRVIKLNPQDKDAYYNLGVLYENYIPDSNLARIYYNKYIILAPKGADVGGIKKWLAKTKQSKK